VSENGERALSGREGDELKGLDFCCVVEVCFGDWLIEVMKGEKAASRLS
jgi:hypothetical protein